jgi:hypothetical protein
VPFERADWVFRLRVSARRELIVGKEFGVRRKEPGPSIGIKNPMSPAPGIAEFGLERPTVGSAIDKFRRRIVLKYSLYDGNLIFDGTVPITGASARQRFCV